MTELRCLLILSSINQSISTITFTMENDTQFTIPNFTNQILFLMASRSVHYRTCNNVIEFEPMTLIKRLGNLLLCCCSSKYLTNPEASMETRFAI